jgi:enediyne biosynthesis protein E5
MLPIKLFKDARYFQIVFQCLLLGYGILFLHWNADWPLYITYMLTCACTQFIFEWERHQHTDRFENRFRIFWQTLPSAIISSLGLCLLLKTNRLWVAALAAFISIASKYIIRYKGKHIFNPSALGIVAVVVFTGKAWISPGQWGSGAVLLFAVSCLGFIITTRIQKLDTSLTFLITFGGGVFIRQIIYLGWPLDFFLQSISTGSLLLFSFFMISDPKTIPNHSIARVGWTILVAVLAFYLAQFKFINSAPIWVLVVLQPMVPVLDGLFRASPFQWKENSDKKMLPATV